MSILLALPTIIQAGKEVFGVTAEFMRYINKLRETARQDREWTNEAEAEFDALLDEAGLAEHWKARQ